MPNLFLNERPSKQHIDHIFHTNDNWSLMFLAVMLFSGTIMIILQVNYLWLYHLWFTTIVTYTVPIVNWPFVRGIHRSPVNSPHKGQWRGALMFSLICAWINGWLNNREAGDLRRHRAHYDVTVMVAWNIHTGLLCFVFAVIMFLVDSCWWLSARLQYLHWNITGDTAVFH